MRIRTIVVPAGGAADAVAFAALQASVLNTAFTLKAAAASISPPRELDLTSAGDLSAVTYTIVGLDRRGNQFTETIVGPNASTVKTNGVYSKVISITPSAANAATMSVGYPQRVVSPWFITDTTRAAEFPPLGNSLVQMLFAPPGETQAAGCDIESTVQNAARLFGEQAQASAGTTSLTPGSTANPSGGAYLRIVNAETTGTARCVLTRPSF